MLGGSEPTRPGGGVVVTNHDVVHKTPKILHNLAEPELTFDFPYSRAAGVIKFDTNNTTDTTTTTATKK